MMKNTTANILAATSLALLFAGCTTQEVIRAEPNAWHKYDLKNFNKADLCFSMRVNDLQKKTVTPVGGGDFRVDIPSYAVGPDTVRSIVDVCEKDTGEKSVFADFSKSGVIFEGGTYFTNNPPILDPQP
ncbi:MAG TPA: hypothetical protein VIG74_01015 [Alphaproteobacteria bacterium]|jgi:hypothetical protein